MKLSDKIRICHPSPTWKRWRILSGSSHCQQSSLIDGPPVHLSCPVLDLAKVVFNGPSHTAAVLPPTIFVRYLLPFSRYCLQHCYRILGFISLEHCFLSFSEFDLNFSPPEWPFSMPIFDAINLLLRGLTWLPIAQNQNSNCQSPLQQNRWQKRQWNKADQIGNTAA